MSKTILVFLGVLLAMIAVVGLSMASGALTYGLKQGMWQWPAALSFGPVAVTDAAAAAAADTEEVALVQKAPPTLLQHNVAAYVPPDQCFAGPDGLVTTQSDSMIALAPVEQPLSTLAQTMAEEVSGQYSIVPTRVPGDRAIAPPNMPAHDWLSPEFAPAGAEAPPAAGTSLMPNVPRGADALEPTQATAQFTTAMRHPERLFSPAAVYGGWVGDGASATQGVPREQWLYTAEKIQNGSVFQGTQIVGAENGFVMNYRSF
jgi:hypothetical protein